MIPVINYVPNLMALPDDLPLEEAITLGRTEVYDIPRSSWSSFCDPRITDMYARSNFVTKYFSVCIFTAEKNLKISLGENMEYSETIDIKHISSTRSSQSSEFRMSNVFEASYGKSSGSTGGGEYSLKDTLTLEYDIKNFVEYYQENSVVSSRKMSYLKAEYDRQIIVWDFKKYIAIYRIYDGRTSLMAVDDYLYGSELLTYKRAGRKYIIIE